MGEEGAEETASASLARAAATSDSGSLVSIVGSVTSISLTFVVLLFGVFVLSSFFGDVTELFLRDVLRPFLSSSCCSMAAIASAEEGERPPSSTMTVVVFSPPKTPSFSLSFAIFAFALCVRSDTDGGVKRLVFAVVGAVSCCV